MKETIMYDGIVYIVRYRHLRRVDTNGDISHLGGTTICYIKDDVSDNVVAEAEAKCSMKDSFCKSFGRMIAKGRLLKKLNSLQFVEGLKLEFGEHFIGKEEC